MSDREVVERAWRELGALMGVTGQPQEALVTRSPGAFPQYRCTTCSAPPVCEAATARLGGLAVASGLPWGRHPGLHCQRAGRRAPSVL